MSGMAVAVVQSLFRVEDIMFFVLCARAPLRWWCFPALSWLLADWPGGAARSRLWGGFAIEFGRAVNRGARQDPSARPRPRR